MFDDVDLQFDIGKVDRRRLDILFIEPPPEPPTKKVLIWGGVEEDYFLYDDPTYVKQVLQYDQRVFVQERQLFETCISYDRSKALTLVDEELYQLTDDLLVTLLSQQQLNKLYSEVLYNSTVTEKGLVNAANMYNVRKYDERIDRIKLPDTDVAYSKQYRDMSIALEAGYTWPEFCALSGQEQSNLVMHTALKATLNYLEQRK